MDFLIATNPVELEKIVTVRETPVGKGVFAARGFEAGDTIALLTGKLIEDPDYDSVYCIEMGPELSLEPDPPFRFLNHSCDPNCWLVSQNEDELEEFESDDDEEQLGLYVRRTIYPGEEITIDYAWAAESAIECHCGSDQCRGWIVDSGELDRLIESHRKEDWIIVESPRCSASPNPEIIYR